MTTGPTHSAREIADRVGGELAGAPEVQVVGLAAPEEATPRHLVLIRDLHHAQQWPACAAQVALVDRKLTLEPGAGRALIRVTDADLALIAVLTMFAPPPARPPRGVHPTAVIDPSAVLGPNLAIGAGVCVGARTRIGAGSILHPHAVVYDDCTLGPDCELHSGAVVRERCELGARVVLHANAVIGADGFSFKPAPDGRGLLKVPQIGIVRLGDDVEIGAGTCIDRATFGATEVGAGTKIDNLCQIGHNCRIGRSVALAAQVGIAGSSTVGDGVLMGGKAGIRDHLTIGAGAQIAAYAAVMHPVPAGARWAGYPAGDGRDTMRQISAVRQLPDLLKSLRALIRSPQAPAPGAPGTAADRQP
jgi:UDP-3-O-[3-hydroxymyristoyl] glucosamine N-acyltransferase